MRRPCPSCPSCPRCSPQASKRSRCRSWFLRISSLRVLETSSYHVPTRSSPEANNVPGLLKTRSVAHDKLFAKLNSLLYGEPYDEEKAEHANVKRQNQSKKTHNFDPKWRRRTSSAGPCSMVRERCHPPFVSKSKPTLLVFFFGLPPND